jgi:hypothetical protein
LVLERIASRYVQPSPRFLVARQKAELFRCTFVWNLLATHQRFRKYRHSSVAQSIQMLKMNLFIAAQCMFGRNHDTGTSYHAARRAAGLGMDRNRAGGGTIGGLRQGI